MVLKKYAIESLVVLGGDGSFAGASRLKKIGVNFIGIPATIDNDILGSDFTLGFDTALNNIVCAIDKIRDTATSHQRCFLIEIMGRDRGDLTILGGLASGADLILVPEIKWSNELIIKTIIKRQIKGNKKHTIVAITENQVNVFALAKEIEKKTNVITRGNQLGYIQRGGKPSFFDRYIGTLFGVKAAECLLEDKTDIYLVYEKGQIVEKEINRTNKSFKSKYLPIIEINNKIT